MFGLEDLFGAYGTVDELELGDRLLEHLRERATFKKHVVSLAEIVQAHEGAPRYYLNEGSTAGSTATATGRPSSEGTQDNPRTGNPRDRAAPIVMLGATDAGRILKVPLVPTDYWGIWRPITAFEANTYDRKRYEEGQQS
jgi:hypothetical protein